MQAVISRVHRIVTTHTGDASSSGASTPARSPTQSAAAQALSSLGGGGASSASSSSVPPTPSHSTTPIHTSASVGASPAASPVHRYSTPPGVPARNAAVEPAVAAPVVVKPEIQLAVERLQYAMLLGERKKAVQALHELARSYITTSAGGDSGNSYGYGHQSQKPRATADHRVLGDAAIPVVLNALISDPRDTELMEAMLEFLQEIVAKSPSTASSLLQQMGSSARGGKSSYSMQGAPTSGIQICLQLLQDPSPWIRGPTITLVKYIQEAKQKEFATAVLECKEGLRRLLEVVEDKREHIRDAALQVLVKLTEREKMVQQFLAFEDGFVRLFQIMEVEGLVEGSSVISDCLQIVNNMVRDNLMTQTLLQEMPFLESHLPQLLSLPSRDAMADEDGTVTSTKSYQKKRALKLGLQLVRFLVAGLHEGVPDTKLDELALREKARKESELSQIQSFIGRQTELMGAIGEIACCQNEDLTDLQLQALDLLELLGSSNGGNQIILVNLQSTPSHLSVLSEFVRLDFAEEETPVSAAATSLLDSLFRNNETTKMAIFQQLNAPPPMDENDDGSGTPAAVPAGRVLLDAVIKNAEEIMQGGVKSEHLRSKTIVAWKSCHRLASLLASSDYCKDLALRIPSEYENPDAQAFAGGRFLTRCLRLLGSSPPNATTELDLPASIFQVKVALLCLLIQWCMSCTKAVQEIVGSVSNLSILVDLFVKEDAGSPRLAAEATHVRGLVAMLLGSCLEFLIDSQQQRQGHQQQGQDLPSSPMPRRPSGGMMTREQLLEMISKRIGLQRFTDAFIQFQQTSLVVACARGSKNQTSRNLLPPRVIYDDEDPADDSHGNYFFSLYERSFIGVYRDLAEKIQKRIIAIYTCADSGGQDGAAGVSANALSAYQDLIRIQDKQVHDLTKQLAEAQAAQSQQGGTVSGDGSVNADKVKREMEVVLVDRLEELKRGHAKDKQQLEAQVKELEGAVLDRETRYNGLTVAFEQLEMDYHKVKSVAPGSSHEAAPVQVNQSLDSQLSQELEAALEKCHDLEQELKEEVQVRLQVERHTSLDKNELEMHHLRLQKEIEDLRMTLAQQDEQIQEKNQILEALDAGQAVLKKENEKLKEQLKCANSEGSNGAQVSQTGGEASHTESEVLRKELTSKQAELDLARETHREFERRFVRLLQGEDASIQDPAARSSPHSTSGKASRVVDQMKEHGVAKEIFSLLETQKAKFIELKRSVEEAVAEKSGLEEQCVKLQSSLKELDGKDHEPANDNLAAAKTALEDEVSRLKALISKQLEELQELRELVDDMESVSRASARELEAKNQEVERLGQLVATSQAVSSEERQAADAKLSALESELAQLLSEREELQRQSADTAKQLEDKVAGVSLAKVELEKQAAELSSVATSSQHHEAENDPIPANNSTLDDIFILLASLEIQCNTLRESLREAKGEEAVAIAEMVSRQRGAISLGVEPGAFV
ncbi:Vesicle tethering protein [Globisporangium polare]